MHARLSRTDGTGANSMQGCIRDWHENFPYIFDMLFYSVWELNRTKADIAKSTYGSALIDKTMAIFYLFYV